MKKPAVRISPPVAKTRSTAPASALPARLGSGLAALLTLGLFTAGAASALTPLPTTLQDFALPGTQPLAITDNLASPSACAGCHSNYGSPLIEPTRTWQGSMVGQAGRDPLTYAAMAVANQDAPHAGDMCIRCHMPKAWLEGRSTPEDASATTAADRQGVQCEACHRLVDPSGAPGAPAADAAILAALTTPVTSVGGAQMVVDPIDRVRGPFDIVADLGSDPHLPSRSVLVSPYHAQARMCGTCHNVPNPVFRRNLAGTYDSNAYDAPIDPADIGLAFPEQQTFTEWENSAFAIAPVEAPQFAGGGNGIAGDYTVSTCQDCHMPGVSGKAAGAGTVRVDMPAHELVGANTFIPTIIPMHPVFGAEVDADVLMEGAARALRMLRRAATVTASIEAGVLSVRVRNDAGHKLPTGYPDGRRMWLHVRALDADEAVVFESGRYVAEDAQLLGYEAAPMDPDYDAYLHVWETHQGISAETSLATGLVVGPSFHLALNSVREFDNRIPPRGFTNAGFEAAGAEPVGQVYVDGQHWDDVTYPVGATAVQAEVTLYYQTTTKEYVEFLRDENITTDEGDILFDLWTEADMGPPVEMAKVFVETDAKVVAACRKNIDKLQAKYFKTYLSEWASCYAATAGSLPCDTVALAAEVAEAQAALRSRLGGADDKRCAGANLTPASVGLGTYCPVPCASIVLFDMDDVADCSICIDQAVGNAALNAAYGVVPPLTPGAVPFGAAASCQDSLGDAAVKLVRKWSSTLNRCENANSTGKNDPALDCSTDPSGKIAKAQEASDKRVDGCTSFTGIEGCALGAANNAAAAQCIEDAIGGVVPAYPSVAYP